MDLHGNAALSWSGRRELAGVLLSRVGRWRRRRRLPASACVVPASGSAVTAAAIDGCWIARRRRGGSPIGRRRSGVAVIVKLRRLRMTAAEIAETLAMPLSTVSGILTRLGLGRLGRLGLEQPVRYERSRPGELDPHRRQEARPDRARCRETLARWQAQH